MWRASAAYSSGWPSRLGKGIWRPARRGPPRAAPRAAACRRGPGAIVITRTPRLARSRAAGSVEADDAALGGRVGDLADLAVEGGDRGRVDADAALAPVVGLVVDHRRRGEPQHVEGADQVHLDHVVEDLQVVRALLAGGPLRPADPGAADRDPQAALGAGRGVDGRLRPARAPSRSPRRSSARSPSSPASASPFSALRSAITTRAPAACRARAVAAPRPEAPPATSALAPSIRTARQHMSLAGDRRPVKVAEGLGSLLPSRRRLSSAPGTRSPSAWRRRASAPSSCVEPLSDEQLNRVYSPILSPLAWDLGHIANFEELWLVQTVGGREPLHGELGRLYDAIENPRSTRGELPILRGDELRSYLEDVRERDARGARRGRPRVGRGPAAAGGFVYEMLIAHEHQHNETMLQLIQMVDGYEPVERSSRRRRSPSAPTARRWSLVEGGEVRDRRRPRRASPTTTSARATRSSSSRSGSTAPRSPTRAYAEFMSETGAEPPMYWEPRRRRWWVRTAMGRREPVDPGAAGDPRLLARGRRVRALGRQAPADRARVGGGRRAAPTASAPTSTSSPSAARPPAPTPTPPRTAARCRCWATSGSGPPRTSSPTPASRRSPTPSTRRSSSATPTRCFAAAPGRRAATSIRPSFRNWDLPERRQIFAGLRCARDADDDRHRACTSGSRSTSTSPPGGPLSGMAARRPRRADQAVQGALAALLLRRARLGAVRADHRAARVLPDAVRARDPRASTRRDRAPRPATRRR